MNGILLMAYGGPSSIGEVNGYYTNIRGGREPSHEQLRELEERYLAIGGKSSLPEITFRQAGKLQGLLSERGSKDKVFVAMKHSRPYIGDVVKEIIGSGVDRLLGLVLVPHFSTMGVAGYFMEVRATISRFNSPLEFIEVNQWYDNPLFIGAWADRIRGKMEGGVQLIFTAHSLPRRILTQGDPYVEQLTQTSRLIADRLHVGGWKLAFQSASRTGEEWLGPDVMEVLRRIKDDGGSALLAPIGFVTDNLEVLYDLDIKSKGMGTRASRVPLLNDSDDFIECLYSIVSGFSK